MIVPGKNERDLAKFAQAHQDAANGGTNALGKVDIVLKPDATETRVDDPLCTPGALPQWRPTSASAAAAMTSVWLKETARGYFVLGHDASPATDRTFRHEMRRP